MPDVSDHLVKSLMRLVRQSTTVPKTSNTRALTADKSDMRASRLLLFWLSFRGDAQHRTRNPSYVWPCVSLDSGLVLRTPRNDGPHQSRWNLSNCRCSALI